VQHRLHVPFVVEQDEDGTWLAEAALTPDTFVNGEGATREAAIDDLRATIVELTTETGIPEQLVVDVEIP
jgi:hypothetical protein